MKLNRGCGCILVALAIVNLLFVIGAIVGVAIGEASVGLGTLAVVVFGANLVASAMMATAALRRLPVYSTTAGQGPSESEGQEEEEGSEEEGPED